MNNRADLYKHLTKIQDELCTKLGFSIDSISRGIIYNWFKENFEVLGQEHHINDYAFTEIKKHNYEDIKKLINHSIAAKFADKLIEEKNYVISDCSTQFTVGTRYEMCVLKVKK